MQRSSLPKSLERREIFEEACGIAKYRYRKTEAERRLAAAGENLERLRDILGELEARVGPLERDSAKAKQFLALSAQRKTLELTLWSDTIRQAKEAIRCGCGTMRLRRRSTSSMTSRPPQLSRRLRRSVYRHSS